MTQRKPGHYPKLSTYPMRHGDDWTGQHLAETVIRERTKRQWSLDMLQLQSGVNKFTLSNLERGDCNTQLKHLVGLARAFGISVTELVGE